MIREGRTASEWVKGFSKFAGCSMDIKDMFINGKAYVNDNHQVNSFVRPRDSSIYNGKSIRVFKRARETNSIGFVFV